MARLITSGLEWNDLANSAVANHPDPISSAGTTAATIVTTNPRTGTYNLRCPYNGASSSFAIVRFTTVTAVTYSLRCCFYVSALPAAGGHIKIFDILAGAQTIPRIYLHEDGSLNRSSNTATGTNLVTAGTYFTLETQWLIDTANAANDTFAWRLNGTLIESLALSMGTTLPAANQISVGAITTTGSPGAINIDLDDIAFNDSTGASQTSWPGDGKVVLLAPISDNARTAGWVGGAGGTTNLFDAVNNTPPVGVADTGTNTSQIRNATAEASASYDANLTTYTNAGIGANDTINVVDPAVATAAPVTTSAKQGLIGMASNPAITTIALSATGTAGAFWQGNAAGTYPTGWKWSHGTTTYAPSVTKGSSPVARITQVTSSTRIADVCALGMYVDYAPGAARSFVFDSRRVARNSLLRR